MSQSSDSIEVIDTKKKNKPTNYFEIPIKIIPSSNTRLQFSSDSTTPISGKLYGDPSRFPFDSYYANLIVVTPFKNILISSFSPTFSSSTNMSWVPTVHKAVINPSEIGISYGNLTDVHLEDTRQYFFPSTSGVNVSEDTFLNFRIDV